MEAVRKKIAPAIKCSLEQLVQTRKEVAAAIEPIIWSNLERGRIRKFLSNGTVNNTDGYVNRVADFYEEWFEYVNLLQIEQILPLWEELLGRLQAWAYNFIRQKGHPPNCQRWQLSFDCAADAGAIISKQRFPYDVHFDCWANVVLQNICLQRLKKLWKPMSISEHDLVDIDKWDEWSQNLQGKGAYNDYYHFEQAQLLLQALEQLSVTQQKFILLYYMEQMTYSEIVLIMGKTKNALYKLHFDSLNRLRNLLKGQPDIY